MGGGEIWEAVKLCDGSKAPGPDGFNFRFIRRFWHIIGGDLIKAIRGFLESGKISSGCNSSFIALIPKVADPSEAKDYRPISLIGCFYKLIAKVLAERLKLVIGSVIGEEQNAFIKGRYILDGALIASEVFNFIRKKKGKGAILKLDFQKAFDNVSWNFLLDTMKSMGFGSRWCNWIDGCLRSASVSILVNGSPTEEFNMSKGLRQGDPLSPFLFLIVAEIFNVAMKETISSGLFKGLSVGENKTHISHLQFADDTIIFGQWNDRNLGVVMALLDWYQLASGLRINLQKSSLYGIGVPDNEIDWLARRIKCKKGVSPFTYLGLPVGASMRKESDWAVVFEKFERRLSDWNLKSLSFGGRLTLIKSVLGGLALYFFSLFKALVIVIQKLERLRRNFFWGGTREGNPISWVKWDLILSSYNSGGLGVGSLRVQNLGLLGKWWWRFKSGGESLWGRVIKSIHGSDGGLSRGDICRRGRGKTTWEGIVSVGWDLQNLGLEWYTSFSRCVGNGETTKFWCDLWVGDQCLKDRFPRLFRLEKEKEVMVLDRIRDPSDWDWIRNPRGRALGELEDLKGVIQSVSLCAGKQDSWRWSCGGFTDFSVHALRKAIENCCAGGSNQSCLIYPWNYLIPKKICIFAWRALQERLPVRVSLDRRGIDLDSVLCPRCNSEPETVSHCLIGCAASLNIWSKIFAWWKWSGFHLCSIKDLLLHPGHSMFNSNILLAWRGVIWVAAYFIWRARNDLIFKRKKACVEATFASIQASAFQWCSRRSKKGAVDWLQWCVDPINASRCLV